MGVPDNNTMLVQVDFEVFGHVQGERIFSEFLSIHWNSLVEKKKEIRASFIFRRKIPMRSFQFN